MAKAKEKTFEDYLQAVPSKVNEKNLSDSERQIAANVAPMILSFTLKTDTLEKATESVRIAKSDIAAYYVVHLIPLVDDPEMLAQMVSRNLEASAIAAGFTAEDAKSWVPKLRPAVLERCAEFYHPSKKVTVSETVTNEEGKEKIVNRQVTATPLQTEIGRVLAAKVDDQGKRVFSDQQILDTVQDNAKKVKTPRNRANKPETPQMGPMGFLGAIIDRATDCLPSLKDTTDKDALAQIGAKYVEAVVAVSRIGAMLEEKGISVEIPEKQENVA